MTITDFLLARIEEDETTALAMVDDDGDDMGLEGMFDDLTTPGGVPWLKGGLSDEFAAMMVRHVVPRRVLRECAAKRAIVKRHPIEPAVDIGGIVGTHRVGCARCHVVSNIDICSPVQALGPCGTILALAAVYSDHPDHDLEWSSDSP